VVLCLRPFEQMKDDEPWPPIEMRFSRQPNLLSRFDPLRTLKLFMAINMMHSFMLAGGSVTISEGLAARITRRR
jgi:hypothetical protein